MASQPRICRPKSARSWQGQYSLLVIAAFAGQEVSRHAIAVPKVSRRAIAVPKGKGKGRGKGGPRINPAPKEDAQRLHEKLVDLVEEIKRQSMDYSKRWDKYCDKYSSGGKRDPRLKQPAFIAAFLKEVPPRKMSSEEIVNVLRWHGELVRRVKVGTRQSVDWKKRWEDYCDTYGGGMRDARHKQPAFIAAFLKEVPPCEMSSAPEILQDWLQESSTWADKTMHSGQVALCIKAIKEQTCPGAAMSVVRSIVKAGLQPCIELYNTAIDFCGEAGDVDSAKTLFDELPDNVRTVVTYNTLMKYYARSGDAAAAHLLLDQMQQKSISPNTRSFNAALHACAIAGLRDDAVHLFEELQKSELRPDQHSYAFLLDSMAKDGDVSTSLRLLDDMHHRTIALNVLNYNSVLNTMALADPWTISTSEAEDLLKTMKKRKVRPEVTTYNNLLNVYAKAPDHVDEAEALLKSMPRKRASPDIVSYNTVLSAYSRSYQPDRAEKLLKVMMKKRIDPNIVSYTTALGSCLEGEVENAEQFLADLLHRRLVPGREIWKHLIDIYAKVGREKSARKIVMEVMPENNITPEVREYSGAMQACAVNGNIIGVERWLADMAFAGLRPSLISYNIALEAATKAKALVRAEKLLEDLLKEGFHPTIETFTPVIKGYFKSGEAERAKSHMQSMRKYSLMINSDFMNSVVRLS